MPLTRQQAKKITEETKLELNKKCQQPQPQPQQSQPLKKHQFDFIDASKEWRKNKIKQENCTFVYI